jgi:hypothetical protein
VGRRCVQRYLWTSWPHRSCSAGATFTTDGRRFGVMCLASRVISGTRWGMNFNTTRHREDANTTDFHGCVPAVELWGAVAFTETVESALDRVRSKEMEFFW